MNPRSLLDQLAAAAGMNFVSALRELIDNCLDADARSVAITYGDNAFSIEDDGRGASDPAGDHPPDERAEPRRQAVPPVRGRRAAVIQDR